MPLRDRWERLSHFWRHVVINFGLALLIEALLHIFHHMPVVQRAENAGLDATIAFFGARGGGDAEPGVAFTVFDIDEASWREWHSPIVTPREKLLAMLRQATASRAAAVVVDLDLTRMANSTGLAPSIGDTALATFLRSYQGTVPIVLGRLIRNDLDDSTRLPVPIPAWFEPVSETAAQRIHWGTVQFVQEVDGMVRRWRLWEPVCRDSTPGVLPSVQLLLGAVLESSTGPLADSLARLAPAGCRMTGEQEGTARVLVWGHELAPVSDEVAERVIFSLRWPPEAGPTRMVQLADGTTVPMLVRIPAHQVSDGAEGIDRRLLDGRVIVIGGSYADSRDSYLTPLGEMPGMAIIVNAIESLRRHGQYGEGKSALKWIVTAVLLLLTSLAYAKFHPLVATLLIIPLIYVLVLPISFFLFNSGVWLDFTAPVLGAQVHELIASAEDAWALRGKRIPAAGAGGHHA